jgi:p-hydroxybenzoate 3-monooxygenase
LRTQVGIIGAGPAGLVLALLLHREGIDTVVLERRDREYIQTRPRAGGLEPGTVERLEDLGVTERLRRDAMRHTHTNLRFGGRTHQISFTELTGKEMTLYPQQELVRDLVTRYIEDGGDVRFEVENVTLDGIASDRPQLRFRHDARIADLECDVIAGCDGFHGVSRAAIPDGVLTAYEHLYPFGWLGIVAEAPPAADTSVYCYHERGFALATMRTPARSRHYLQVDGADDISAWPDERIWEELNARTATDGEPWHVNEGEITAKAITPMRSFVVEPMQHGRLFLAGDAAHIVPPTGAKGLNLAVADAWTLGQALLSWYRGSGSDLLDAYSSTCLRRVWRRQEFSIYMTELLHRMDSDQPAFRHRLALSRLEYLLGSRAASTSLAENYVGFDWE